MSPPDLLAAGEHAAFHGPPGDAVAVLEEAVVAGQQRGSAAEVSAAAWLLGVSLGACGRYGGALTVLGPLVEAGEARSARPEARLFGGFAAATVASVHRQLGRHEHGRVWDERALDIATAPEVELDGNLGLAADAVGLGDADEAQARLADATALAEQHGEDWWRQRVRCDWVRAEVALLEGRGADAVQAASAAVEAAERAEAPRHVAKSLLFLGVSLVDAERADEAPAVLRRAAELAEQLGTVPLVWPARAVLGALVADDDPAESARCLAAARAAAETILRGLPPTLREGWSAKPDVAALLSATG